MRMIMLSVVIFTVVGCAALYSGNMSGIVQSTQDFTFNGIDSQAAVFETSSLAAGDRAVAVEFGADSCLVANFTGNDQRYSVEVVTFSGPKGAAGYFIATDPEGSFPVDIGENGRRNDTMLQFVKGIVVMTITPQNGDSFAGAEALAGELEGRIRTPGITVDIFGTLPKKSRNTDTELFFMGRRIFAKRYSADLAEALNVANIKEGAAATYAAGRNNVEFIKIRYYNVKSAKEAINSFLKANADDPVVMPGEAARYYTVVHSDRSETYIVDYADWVYVMPSVRSAKESRELYEYFLRGGM